eukprot:1637939-Alexandrium_andersonii.AAC.1
MSAATGGAGCRPLVCGWLRDRVRWPLSTSPGSPEPRKALGIARNPLGTPQKPSEMDSEMF